MNLLSFMGTSDCGLFFSDKDSNSMEFNSISKPTSEFQEKTHTHDDHQLQEQQGEQEVKGEISVSCLKIKTPSLGEFKDEEEEEEEEEGCRTPTCLDQIIPLVPQCPPAPRKPKKMLLMKRKAASRRTLLDLSSEVEALFPPSLLVNLGGKIKKVRTENSTK